MTSLIAGMATAVFFAVGTIAASRASRILPAPHVVGLSAAVAAVVVVPWAAIQGVPQFETFQLLLMLVSGVGNIFGFLCVYVAFRYGKVGLVAPIVATEGGIAAVIASFLGRSVEPLIGFVLLMIVIGILIAARSKDPDPFPGERPVLAAGFASLGACLFAIGLISTGFLSGELPLAWVLLPARIVGVLLFTLPLLLSGRLRVTRQAFLWVLLLAAADLLGIGMYTIGAAQNLPVTAVLASQMAPLAAILAFFLFRERLGKGQIAGLIIMVGGVTLLALLQ
ncbi:MAG: EamA family transporter [Actinobacteria bacterium]|nr:EamA family transporter [Actinomycetota bacterium]MSY97077.1 EamA family transporter [Actinomycetota bacterium]